MKRIISILMILCMMVFVSCFSNGSPSSPEEDDGEGGGEDNKMAVMIVNSHSNAMID
ncbi:hypothetical protein ACFL6O_03485 [candidate division KSB1 bacterium]